LFFAGVAGLYPDCWFRLFSLGAKDALFVRREQSGFGEVFRRGQGSKGQVGPPPTGFFSCPANVTLATTAEQTR
jgi:hypothetical protein